MIFLCLFCGVATLQAQYLYDKDVSAEPRKNVWRYETKTWKTAFVVPKKELHLSILSPVRYGLLPSVELQSFVGLWAFATPNVYLKKNWWEDRWVVSSKHGLVYPTLGLKVLRKDNRKNTIRPTANIPQILAIQNEIILSYVLNPTCMKEEAFWIATFRLGTDFAIAGTRDETFNRMTYFSLFHRTASFYGDNVTYAGVQLEGDITRKIYFNAGADAYMVDFDGLNAYEVQANIIYHYNQKLSFALGAKYIHVDSALEKESNYAPMMDVTYRFGKRGGYKKGLFKK